MKEQKCKGRVVPDLEISPKSRRKSEEVFRKLEKMRNNNGKNPVSFNREIFKCNIGM